MGAKITCQHTTVGKCAAYKSSRGELMVVEVSTGNVGASGHGSEWAICQQTTVGECNLVADHDSVASPVHDLDPSAWFCADIADVDMDEDLLDFDLRPMEVPTGHPLADSSAFPSIIDVADGTSLDGSDISNPPSPSDFVDLTGDTTTADNKLAATTASSTAMSISSLNPTPLRNSPIRRHSSRPSPVDTSIGSPLTSDHDNSSLDSDFITQPNDGHFVAATNTWVDFCGRSSPY
ncbi:hypothetical protein ACA910_010804 [Epithemia clementina (nom. ined.)]